jgi:hypothetical protein
MQENVRFSAHRDHYDPRRMLKSLNLQETVRRLQFAKLMLVSATRHAQVLLPEADWV